MSGSGWRPHIESLRCLDLRRMINAKSIEPNCSKSGFWIWTDTETGERVASISYLSTLESESGEIRLSYSIPSNDEEPKQLDYVVRLESIHLNFGGRRWYFTCPSSGRRAQKLYLVQGIFVSRQAIRPKPTYSSQRVSGIARTMERRWVIRRKLNDSGSLFDALTKPKWMRLRTWERYESKDAHLSTLEDMYVLKRWRKLLD